MNEVEGGTHDVVLGQLANDELRVVHRDFPMLNEQRLVFTTERVALVRLQQLGLCVLSARVAGKRKKSGTHS
jgi:hypothetical protein